MSQDGWRRWSFDDVREARHAQETTQARDRYRQELQTQARARTREQEGVQKTELARLFAKWARKHHISGDHIFNGSLTRKWLIASEYGASGGETHRYPDETWISWTGKLHDGNGFTLEQFESRIRSKIAQYDYPWPP